MTASAMLSILHETERSHWLWLMLSIANTVNDKEARHGTFISCTAVVSCGCTYTAQNAVQQTLQGGQGTDIIGGTEKWSVNLKQWCWELSLQVEVHGL